MKRILVIAILLLIALLFLYAAQLDGVLHIQAFAAENKCEFCEFLETHDIKEDLQFFPQNTVGSMKSIDYELVLNARLVFGHDRSARRALVRGVEMNFCPECGKRIVK